MTRNPPPMDFFSDVFQWHDKYLPPLVRQDGLLLLSENEVSMLGSPGVLAVERVLREGVSLASHCRTEGAPVLLAEMLHALEALVRQGLARPVRGGDAARYVVPDFSSPFARIHVNEHADAIVLSDAMDRDAATRWGQAVAEGDANLTIVFCDDYLDPRLNVIDAQQRTSKRPWLLAKPAGEQAMVGPLFTPHAAAATACWHCLAHRLIRNKPARAWWQDRHGGQAIGVPLQADAELVGARLKSLLPLARNVVERASQQLWTLEPLQPHAVVARPQCPQCGASSLIKVEGCNNCLECGYSKCS